MKRKLEYKNTHKRQLVDPKKIVKMLELLKRSRNPYYQSHDDIENFEGRCKEEDPEGYEVIFPSKDQLEEDMVKVPQQESQRPA